MERVVPLIRMAATIPLVNWLRANGKPVERWLASVDLGFAPLDEPDSAIPLLPTVEFLRMAAREEGPDIGARAVGATSTLDLASLSKVALATRTLREGLHAAAASLSHHGTHEFLTLSPVQGGLLIRYGWTLPFDQEALYLLHQYPFCMIGSLCSMTGRLEAHFLRASLQPHPDAGLDHLRPWITSALSESRSRSVELVIADSLLDSPFQVGRRSEPLGKPSPDWAVMRVDGGFIRTARVVLAEMATESTPTIDRLARAAGMSRRSLQRSLRQECTTFTSLIDGVRKSIAMQEIAHGDLRPGDVAAALGYSHQPSLTRSVRRWTGTSPRRFDAAEKH